MTISAHNLHEEKVLQDHLIDQLVAGEGYERRDPAEDHQSRVRSCITTFSRHAPLSPSAFFAGATEAPKA